MSNILYIVLFGILCLVGCDSESTIDEPGEAEEPENNLLERIDRAWELQTVNGRPLPYTIHAGLDTLIILRGSVEFHSTLSYDRTTSSETICGGSASSFCQNPFPPTYMTKGTYSLIDSTFHVVRSDGLRQRAYFDSQRLAIIAEGTSLTFRYE